MRIFVGKRTTPLDDERCRLELFYVSFRSRLSKDFKHELMTSFCLQTYQVDTWEYTVDSGYSHTKCFQEKCDYKRSVTLSGVTQNSCMNTRKSIFIA